MFANQPEMAHEWAHHTPDIKKLPEKVKKEPEKRAVLITGNQPQRPQVSLTKPMPVSTHSSRCFAPVPGQNA
jgi:hypothetical protein